MTISSKIDRIQRRAKGDGSGCNRCRGFQHICLITDPDDPADALPTEPDQVWCPVCGRDCVLVIRLVYEQAAPIRHPKASGKEEKQR